MATTDDSPSFDDLETVEVDSTDDGSNWISLEPGEEVTGEITAFNPRASDNGVVEIDGRPYSLNATMRRKVIEALVVGANIGVRKSEEEESFDNGDETVSYNPREVRVSA